MIHTFGLFIGLGVAAGLYIGRREAIRRRLDPDAFLLAVLAGLGAGLGGARLLYVLLHLGDYLSAPALLWRFDEGGLALFGGLAGGLGGAWLVARRLRLPFIPALDAAAPAIPLAYAIGRIGCDIYGKVTHLPWAVYVNGLPHHPSQGYSAVLGLGIFAYIWLVRRRHQVWDGELFAWYVGLYAVGRFLIEFTRYADAMAGPLTLTQAVLIPVALTAFALLRHRGRLAPAAAGERLAAPPASHL